MPYGNWYAQWSVSGFRRLWYMETPIHAGVLTITERWFVCIIMWLCHTRKQIMTGTVYKLVCYERSIDLSQPEIVEAKLYIAVWFAHAR